MKCAHWRAGERRKEKRRRSERSRRLGGEKNRRLECRGVEELEKKKPPYETDCLFGGQ